MIIPLKAWGIIHFSHCSTAVCQLTYCNTCSYPNIWTKKPPASWTHSWESTFCNSNQLMLYWEDNELLFIMVLCFLFTLCSSCHEVADWVCWTFWRWWAAAPTHSVVWVFKHQFVLICENTKCFIHLIFKKIYSTTNQTNLLTINIYSRSNFTLNLFKETQYSHTNKHNATLLRVGLLESLNYLERILCGRQLKYVVSPGFFLLFLLGL